MLALLSTDLVSRAGGVEGGTEDHAGQGLQVVHVQFPQQAAADCPVLQLLHRQRVLHHLDAGFC